MSAKILQTFGGGVWWRSSVLYYLFVGFGGILDGFQSMSLVFELITELSQFGGSVTSLLIDPFAAFITHLLSCVKILTLRRKKQKIVQRMRDGENMFDKVFSEEDCGSYPFFLISSALWLTVLRITPDQVVIEIRNQEGRIVTLPHCFRHLEDTRQQSVISQIHGIL